MLRRSLIATWFCSMCAIATPLFLARAQDAPKKLPVPQPPAVEKAKALILEIFKDDLAAAKDADSLIKLATFLLQQARDPKDEPANRYVLFQGGRELAAKA